MANENALILAIGLTFVFFYSLPIVPTNSFIGVIPNTHGYNHSMHNNDITIKTDKDSYAVGEAISFNVTNFGTKTIEFPDSALGFNVKDSEGEVIFNFLSAQVITDLEPGQSKILEWNQLDVDEKQPKPGTYLATVRTIEGNQVTVTFRIE